MKKSNNITSFVHSPLNPSLNIINQQNSEILRIVGVETKRLMRERGISYRELAKKVGCDHTMIYYIVNNRVKYCSLSLLSALAYAFGCTLLGWLRSAPIEEEKKGVFE